MKNVVHILLFVQVFLLSGGGKINYIGTKRWLDEQKEDPNSEILTNLKLAICIDSLGANSNNINMFVSKPPKEGTIAFDFLEALRTLSKKLYPEVKVNYIHKKINLASEFLSWEHERFSIHKLSALTLSHYETSDPAERRTILDRDVDEKIIFRNVHLISEALACLMYNLNKDYCMGQIFTGLLIFYYYYSMFRNPFFLLQEIMLRQVK
jgi:hypothetical protein